MKKIVYSALIISLIAALVVVLKQKPVKVEAFTLKKVDFEETLSAEGRVRSRTKKVLHALASGDLENFKVKQGEIVKKNQVLGSLFWDRKSPIQSPMSGVVSKLFRESDGPINRGEPILEVSGLDDLEVVVELKSQDAIQLSPGNEVKITNWGGEGIIEGRLTQISRAGTVKTSALGVDEEKTEVKVEFKKIAPELKNKLGDTYHVDVVFIISKEQGALALPLGALFKSGERWAVYKITENRATLTEVDLSKRNDRQALITRGLEENDRVILFPGDKIREGTRVEF